MSEYELYLLAISTSSEPIICFINGEIGFPKFINPDDKKNLSMTLEKEDGTIVNLLVSGE